MEKNPRFWPMDVVNFFQCCCQPHDQATMVPAHGEYNKDYTARVDPSGKIKSIRAHQWEASGVQDLEQVQAQQSPVPREYSARLDSGGPRPYPPAAKSSLTGLSGGLGGLGPAVQAPSGLRAKGSGEEAVRFASMRDEWPRGKEMRTGGVRIERVRSDGRSSEEFVDLETEIERWRPLGSRVEGTRTEELRGKALKAEGLTEDRKEIRSVGPSQAESLSSQPLSSRSLISDSETPASLAETQLAVTRTGSSSFLNASRPPQPADHEEDTISGLTIGVEPALHSTRPPSQRHDRPSIVDLEKGNFPASASPKGRRSAPTSPGARQSNQRPLVHSPTSRQTTSSSTVKEPSDIEKRGEKDTGSFSRGKGHHRPSVINLEKRHITSSTLQKMNSGDKG